MTATTNKMTDRRNHTQILTDLQGDLRPMLLDIQKQLHRAEDGESSFGRLFTLIEEAIERLDDKDDVVAPPSELNAPSQAIAGLVDVIEETDEGELIYVTRPPEDVTHLFTDLADRVGLADCGEITPEHAQEIASRLNKRARGI